MLDGGAFNPGHTGRHALSITALLAEPAVLIADEPANGLDPAGITWMRALLRDLAERGTAVLLSSYLLSEAERLIDDVIVISRGRLVAQGSLEQLRGVGAAERGLEERFLELTADQGGNLP